MLNYSQNKVYSNFKKTVLDHVPNLNGLQVLDLGCGTGETGAALKKNQTATIYGITLSKEEALLAKEKIDDCFVFNLENGLPDFLKSKKFDVVLMSHVLEHICYPTRLFEDLKDVLSDNGRIIITLPNIMHYNSRFKLFLGNFEYTETGIYDYTHFRWYTFRSAQRLFESNGFKIILKDVTVSMPIGRYLNRIPSEKIKFYIYKLLKNISKGFFGWELVYVLEK